MPTNGTGREPKNKNGRQTTEDRDYRTAPLTLMCSSLSLDLTSAFTCSPDVVGPFSRYSSATWKSATNATQRTGRVTGKTRAPCDLLLPDSVWSGNHDDGDFECYCTLFNRTLAVSPPAVIHENETNPEAS